MRQMEETGKDACSCCAALARRLEEAERDPHREYDAVLRMAADLIQEGAVELFAGDCLLEEADEVLRAERHYTVCHYLRCRACGAVYFVGACIRGKPVYRRVTNLKEENLSFRLWGRRGSFFAAGGRTAPPSRR